MTIRQCEYCGVRSEGARTCCERGARADQGEGSRNPRWQFEMPEPCHNCPFLPGGIELMPGRLDAIKDTIRAGQQFVCHKSVDYRLLGENEERDEDGEEPIIDLGRRGCAGARRWARVNGCENLITRHFDLQDRLQGTPNPEQETYRYDPTTRRHLP